MSSEDKKQTMRKYYVDNKDKMIDCFKTYYQDNYAEIRERNLGSCRGKTRICTSDAP